jgi:hypothetical protein
MITGEFEGPIIKPIYTTKSSSFQPTLIWFQRNSSSCIVKQSIKIGDNS